jgi:Tol biopolymer transport system component
MWYYDPAWSLGGHCLAYTSGGYPTGSHWYSGVEVIRGAWSFGLPGGSSAVDGSPSWDPSGRRLVLVGYEFGDGGELYVQGVESASDSVLPLERSGLVGDVIYDTPAWSHDGSRIAFIRIEGGIRSLAVARVDGSGFRELTTIAARNPSWSPDDRRLVFDDGRRIAVVNADGTQLRYLTYASGVDVDPAWSPDGHTIAFTRYHSAKAAIGDIWLMNTTGHNQRLVVNNGSEPTWKPIAR